MRSGSVSLLSHVSGLERSFQRGYDITRIVSWALGPESIANLFFFVFSRRDGYPHHNTAPFRNYPPELSFSDSYSLTLSYARLAIH